MNAGRFVHGAFAVVVGYALFAVPVAALFTLTGHEPHAPASLAFMTISTLYGVALAFGVGYLTALIAGTVAPAAPAALAILVACGAAISAIVDPAGGSIWSQVAAAVFMTPAVVAGGALRRRRRASPIVKGP